MKKLAIIVPTANREKTIDYWLKEVANDARNNNVDVIIYDSSSNRKTHNVVTKYIKKGFDNVLYCKYTGHFDGVSLDNKLIDAYKDFSRAYEYIWLIRDGLIPMIDMFYQKLTQLMAKRYDCIIVDALYRNYYQETEVEYLKEKREYTKLLQEQAHRMQTLGMLIFESNYALDLIEKVPVDEKTYSLWQMAAPLHHYAIHGANIVFYIGDTFTFNPMSHKGHFWGNGAKLFEQWGVRWCKVIDGLPECYDSAKESVYKIYTCDFHPFSPKAVAGLRAYGGMNKEMVDRYKSCIERTTDTPISFFYEIANMPVLLVRFYLRYPNRRGVIRYCIKLLTEMREDEYEDPYVCLTKMLLY